MDDLHAALADLGAAVDELQAAALAADLPAEDRAAKEAVRRQVEERFEKEEAAARARWERSPEGREARLNERLAALEVAGR
jgi:hypothetical protein